MTTLPSPAHFGRRRGGSPGHIANNDTVVDAVHLPNE
jgi:hypothetical protein